MDDPEIVATTASRLVPVLPLKDVSLFPGASLAVVLSRPQAISAVRLAERSDAMLLALTHRDPEAVEIGPRGLHTLGTLGTICEALAVSPLELRLEVDGVARAHARELVGTRLMIAEAVLLPEEDEGDEAGPAVKEHGRSIGSGRDELESLRQGLRGAQPPASLPRAVWGQISRKGH